MKPAIRLTDITVTQAEEAIARAWCVLEAGRLASPAASIRFPTAVTVILELVFDDERDAEVVLAELSRHFPKARLSPRR